MFMPRWASRLTLEITNVRCERLHDQSRDDLFMEGYDSYFALKDYMKAWDALNAKRGYGWDTNPWVWVIEFKKIEGGDR